MSTMTLRGGNEQTHSWGYMGRCERELIFASVRPPSSSSAIIQLLRFWLFAAGVLFTTRRRDRTPPSKTTHDRQGQAHRPHGHVRRSSVTAPEVLSLTPATRWRAPRCCAPSLVQSSSLRRLPRLTPFRRRLHPRYGPRPRSAPSMNGFSSGESSQNSLEAYDRDSVPAIERLHPITVLCLPPTHQRGLSAGEAMRKTIHRRLSTCTKRLDVQHGTRQGVRRQTEMRLEKHRAAVCHQRQ